MPFSLSGGLSEMGKSIASTAGDMIINQQRSELEKQRIQLAESLAEGRETRGRQQQADINATAAEKSQAFQASESLLNRGHEDTMLDKREAGENTRAKLSRDQTLALHQDTESNENVRAQAELAARVDMAKEAADNKKQADLLEAVVKANRQPVLDSEGMVKGYKYDVPAIADGLRRAAKSSGDSGLEDMANIFMPKPGDAKKGNVTGRPPLSSFSK